MTRDGLIDMFGLVSGVYFLDRWLAGELLMDVVSAM